MWLMTTAGYVSIVAKGGKDVLMVRARDVDSLKAFCVGADVPASRIITGTGTDYPHRIKSNADEVKKFLLAEVEWIQYSNFKDEAKTVKGKKFADFLSRVWTASLSIEDVEFKKWNPHYLDFNGEYDWTEPIDEKLLTQKAELGYDKPKPKHRKTRKTTKGKRNDKYRVHNR